MDGFLYFCCWFLYALYSQLQQNWASDKVVLPHAFTHPPPTPTPWPHFPHSFQEWNPFIIVMQVCFCITGHCSLISLGNWQNFETSSEADLQNCLGAYSGWLLWGCRSVNRVLWKQRRMWPWTYHRSHHACIRKSWGSISLLFVQVAILESPGLFKVLDSLSLNSSWWNLRSDWLEW